MKNKYVATIMNRIFLGDDNYFYYPSHTTLGEYDEETGIFKDRNGQEYCSISDRYALQSELSTGFANLENMYDIPSIMDTEDMAEAIAKYHQSLKRTLFFVYKSDDNYYFTVPLDLDDLKQGVTDLLEKTQTEVTYEEDEDYDEEECPAIREQLAEFLIDINNGKYSLDDLKAMCHQLNLEKDELQLFIDSLELQIEASEYGESSIHLKDEDKIVKKQRPSKMKKAGYISLDKYLDIKDLFQKITKTLIAQDEPLRRVLIEIARKEQSELNNDRGILITGQTGSGKTFMMELIARYLDRPFHKVDSTQLTIPGYVGKDIEEVLWELYVKCGRNIEEAERAIIFFDEIDKKGSGKKDDVSGKGVLNVLLPFFDGATYDACESTKAKTESVKINTRNMLVILGGAFEDVYKNLQVQRSVGFASEGKDFSGTRAATTQDFVEKAQMPSEFMGRVAIVKLNDLTADDIRRILLEGDESALEIQKKLFKELGVTLTPSDGYIDEIVRQAVERKTGARGLNTVVDESTWEAYGDVYTNLGKYKEIILGKETVNDPKQYQKVEREKTLVKQ